MPAAHLRFLYFDNEPVSAGVDDDLLADLTKDNNTRTRPYAPMWLMPDHRR